MSGQKGIFRLLYGVTEIGTLELVEGLWKFHYSDEFRRNNHFRAITEFPNPGQEYSSPNLWPFFLMRIPSLKQPEIKAIIEREQIDDEVTLLRRFGRRTISNPFELIPDD